METRFNAFTAGLLVGLCVTTVVGCNKSASEPDLPPPVEVKGVITVDGHPAPDVMVYFTPDGGKDMGHGASALTDGNGAYELQTVLTHKPYSGAIPGEYRVWISRLVGPGGTVVSPKGDVAPANMGAAESLPPRFSDLMKTELRAKVTLKGGAFDFNVTLK